MDDHEVEEHGEDVGAWVAVGHGFGTRRWDRRPEWAENAGFDGVVDLGSMRFGVGAEELEIKLGEDIPDPVCFVGELHAEEGFEEREELWGYFRLEGRHVGEG